MSQGAVALLTAAALPAHGALVPATIDPASLAKAVREAGPIFQSGLELEATLTVAPDGTAAGCVVTAGNGDAKARDVACAILEEDARFEPARVDGVAVYGVVKTGLALAQSGNAPKLAVPPAVPDVEFDVASLPAELAEDPSVHLAVFVSADGTLSRCERLDGAQALASAACSALKSGAALPQAKGASGNFVSYVRSYSVHFNVAS